MAVLGGGVAYTVHKDKDYVFGCLEAASECMKDANSLLMMPITESGIKALVFLVCAPTFLALLSMDNSILHLISVIYYIFMCLWISDILSAQTHFVGGYITEEWFFGEYHPGFVTKKMEAFPLTRAYKACAQYHLGSMALGSVVIVVLRPFRTIFRFATFWARRRENPPACCGGCINAYQRIAPYTEAAYLDMAYNGDPFFESAKAAQAILAPKGYEEHDVQVHEALFVIQIGGAVAIASLCSTVIFLVAKSADWIQDKGMVAGVSFPIAFAISWPFMSTFGHVCDALIYCFKLDSKTQAESMSSMFGLDVGPHQGGSAAAGKDRSCQMPEIGECFGIDRKQDAGAGFQMPGMPGADMFSSAPSWESRFPPKTAGFFNKLGGK
eukprot:TRINITY_DN80607_c0_g1_i1.p1 TRINITY_DN80607_c0_g1~~TRINITY_DN80607_c0_g1_i1.p1  ORF type:complete len:433 (+),score=55.30 TRINITY_DN80607_c0_g1_i1:151-1299(+)